MSLTDKTIGSTYKDILTIENSNAGFDTNVDQVKSGNGTEFSSANSSYAGDVYAGLSDNATYNSVASYHEVEIYDAMSRGAWRTLTHTWTLTADTLPAIGTSETIWVGFKSTSTTGTPLLSWGGNATNKSPDFIMKATALPATILT